MFLHICLCEVIILFFSARFHSASCDVFYIVTANSPCSEESIGVPCLTLQQYVSNPIQSENITFLVEPGTHYLSAELPISNGYSFTMTSSNATVTCTSSTARLSFDSVENVYISGITFQMCSNSAIKMRSVTDAYVTYSNFVGSEQSGFAGGAINVRYSTVIIDHSTFTGNKVVGCCGGAIYAHSSMITIDQSIFIGNADESIKYSSYGGALFASSSTITIDQSNFSGNGAIAPHSNSLQCFEHAHGSGYGGAIYASSSSITIDRSTFSENRASGYYGYGGAIYATDHSVIIVNMSLFNHNVGSSCSHTLGGAIYGEGVTADRSAFIHNTAMAHDGVGTGYGGAIHGSNVTVERSMFSHNTAHSSGGAIYVAGAKRSVSVSASSFINNTAIREGGGAIYSNGRFTSVTLSSSTFNYNSASYCSVLDVDLFSVNFTNSLFTYNTATGQTFGGGVACIRNASINILNSVFKHNFANYHAGVFYIDGSVTTVDGSIFINNSAALDGGVFYTYRGIHSSDYIITRSRFSGNAAGDDGGVMLIGWLNCFVGISDSIFNFNSAADRGGVIALSTSSMYMEINRTNIFNNTAQFGEVISTCNGRVTFEEDVLTASVDPFLSSCTLYEGQTRDFNLTIPDPEIILTTASSVTTELPTKTERLTTTEPPITNFTFTTTEAPMSTRPPTQDSNLITRIEQTSTSRSVDEEINQNHTRVQSTTTEQTQNDESLVTVKVVVTNARITATVITVATISLMLSFIILIIILVPRLRYCLRKNEWNKSKVSQNKALADDELAMIDQMCSLPTYSSPVFDPHDDNSENNF